MCIPSFIPLFEQNPEHGAASTTSLGTRCPPHHSLAITFPTLMPWHFSFHQFSSWLNSSVSSFLAPSQLVKTWLGLNTSPKRKEQNNHSLVVTDALVTFSLNLSVSLCSAVPSFQSQVRLSSSQLCLFSIVLTHEIHLRAIYISHQASSIRLNINYFQSALLKQASSSTLPCTCSNLNLFLCFLTQADKIV